MFMQLTSLTACALFAQIEWSEHNRVVKFFYLHSTFYWEGQCSVLTDTGVAEDAVWNPAL